MNILIIVKSIDGGTGTFLINLLKIKKILNCNITTLVLEKPTYRKFSKYKFKYMRRRNFYPLLYSLTFKNLISFIFEAIWVGKQITNIHPDIVLSIDLRCNLLAVILKLATFSKYKVVITNHINLSDTIFVKSTSLVSKLLKMAIKLFYNRADMVVAVSKGLAKSVKKDFGVLRPVKTVYNGLKTKSVKPRKIESIENLSFVSVGRLGEQKDFETLIMAFKEVSLKKPNIRLKIVGNGPDKKHLESIIKKNDLSTKVFIKGWSLNVLKDLKESDVFVHSSKREGFAYVILEAMSSGLPVISTNSNYGPSEILDNGKYGILTKVGDVKMLSNAMQKVISNKKVYEMMSIQSALRVNSFTVEKMLLGYKKIFNNMYE